MDFQEQDGKTFIPRVDTKKESPGTPWTLSLRWRDYRVITNIKLVVRAAKDITNATLIIR